MKKTAREYLKSIGIHALDTKKRMDEVCEWMESYHAQFEQIVQHKECTHPKGKLINYHDMSIKCTKCGEVIFQSFDIKTYRAKAEELGLKIIKIKRA